MYISKVSLNLTRCVPKDLAYARSIATAMTGNVWFPSPTPALAVFETDIDALDVAQAAMLTRTRGFKEARDARALVVYSDLRQLQAYVQGVADVNATNADEIIVSAGMSVKRIGHPTRAALEARPGPVSGSVRLVVPWAGDRVCYHWQMSTDERSWTWLPKTLTCKTTVSGLAVGVWTFFRSRLVTPAGVGDFSDPVSIVVV
jgi:hypothetical protein